MLLYVGVTMTSYIRKNIMGIKYNNKGMLCTNPIGKKELDALLCEEQCGPVEFTIYERPTIIRLFKHHGCCWGKGL
jgi:hypothetical protein